MENMNVAQAIIAIKNLFSELTKRIKDRESASFVQQIQTHQHILEAAYLEAEHKALDYHREAVRLESDSRTRDDEIKLLKSQMQELEAKLKKLNSQALLEWSKQKAAQNAQFRKRHTLNYNA